MLDRDSRRERRRQVIVGILAVLGAFALLRFVVFLGFRRRWMRRRGWGRHGYGARRAWLFRQLFERLDATPAQETIVLDGAAALHDDLAAARAEWLAIRDELATLLAQDALDRGRLESLAARPTEKLGAARARLVETVASLHAALQGAQRRRLAELVRD